MKIMTNFEATDSSNLAKLQASNKNGRKYSSSQNHLLQFNCMVHRPPFYGTNRYVFCKFSVK